MGGICSNSACHGRYIYIATVRSNTGRIDKVEIKSHENEGDIRDLKKDVTYIREGIDRIEKSVKQ